MKVVSQSSTRKATNSWCQVPIIGRSRNASPNSSLRSLCSVTEVLTANEELQLCSSIQSLILFLPAAGGWHWILPQEAIHILYVPSIRLCMLSCKSFARFTHQLFQVCSFQLVWFNQVKGFKVYGSANSFNTRIASVCQCRLFGLTCCTTDMPCYLYLKVLKVK